MIRTLMLAATLTLGACAGGATQGGGATVAPDEVDAIVSLARKIKADPGNADAILKEAGMTRDAIEGRLFDIAEDAAASKRYAEALGSR